MVDVRARPSLSAALIAPALALVVVGVPPAAATTSGSTLTAVLTLTQDTGDRARLHRLAEHQRTQAGRAVLAELAPPAARRDAAVRWARRRGLSVQRADAWTVTVTGAASDIARAFGTSVRRSSQGTWAAHPQVPASLRGQVEAVVGLDSRPYHRRHATLDGLANPQSPSDVRATYDVPPAWRGAGVTVGVLNLAGWDPSDLTTFAKKNAITLAPGQVTEVAVGADPHVLDGAGGEFEVGLDAEAVLGVAPAARQRLYFAPNTGSGVISALQQMAADAEAGKIQVATTSWGSCEKQLNQNGSDGVAAYSAAIDRLVAAGATLFAASGDAGAFDCSLGDAPDNEAQVDFPASYVNTVAVGGTTLTPGAAEVAWRDNGYGSYLGDGSGGGESLLQPQPPYQAGLVSGTSRRLLPDVSSDADPQSGLQVYIRSAGGWNLAGGTSLAAPTWAAMLADALSSQSRTSGLGNILPALYASASDTESPGLVDVTGGHNGLYTAGVGYDRVTGLGVARWEPLAADLLAAPSAVPASMSLDAPAQRPGAAPDPTVRVLTAYLRTTSTPLSVTIPAGSSYSGFAAAESVGGCAYLQDSPPTTANLDPDPFQGTHLVTVTALDASLTCHAVVVPVVYDSVPPLAVVTAGLLTTADTRVLIGLGGTDLTSGIASWHVVVRPIGEQPVVATDTTSRQLVLALTPGKTYSVEVFARDRSGNQGVVSATRVTVPLDDAVFARTGAWGRDSRTGDYQGTHLRSSSAGSTARYVFDGRDVIVSLLRSASSGYADVYIDGRRTQRLDLYGPTTALLRVRLGTWSVAGRHTVQLTVVGAHGAVSRGSNVLLDAVTVAS